MPSKISGYKNNSLELHERYKNDGRSGTYTDKKIDSIIGSHRIKRGSECWNDLETSRKEYYKKYGILLGEQGGKRTYWLLDDEVNGLGEKRNGTGTGTGTGMKTQAEGAEEGGIRTMQYNAAERDKSLRNLKLNECRDNNNGHIVCEICGLYVKIDNNNVEESMFEIHHTRPIGALGKRKTTLNVLAVLCRLCHGLVHYKGFTEDDTLSIAEAKRILPKRFFAK